jgi:hypothetical protein
VRFWHQYQNKGLNKSCVLIFLRALRKMSVFECGRVGEVHHRNGRADGASKSAVQGSAGGLIVSRKLWY